MSPWRFAKPRNHNTGERNPHTARTEGPQSIFLCANHKPKPKTPNHPATLSVLHARCVTPIIPPVQLRTHDAESRGAPRERPLEQPTTARVPSDRVVWLVGRAELPCAG